MKEYSYVAKTNSGMYEGVQNAESPEAALKILERMGFKDIMINDIAQLKSQLPSKNIEPIKSSILTPVLSTKQIESQEDMTNRLGMMISGLGNDVQNVGEEARKAKNIISSEYRKNNEKEEVKIQKNEEVIIGDKGVLVPINEKLKSGYSVKFPPVMRLDSQGKMQYLFILQSN